MCREKIFTKYRDLLLFIYVQCGKWVGFHSDLEGGLTDSYKMYEIRLFFSN